MLAALLLIGGVQAAARAIAAPEPLLAQLDPWIAPLAAGAARVEDAGPGLLVCAAVALALLAWPFLVWRRPLWRAAPLALACCLAWLGQALLLAHFWLAGLACFALALGVCGLRWKAREPVPDPPLPLAGETLAWLLFTGLFLALAAYRIEVRPDSTLDEQAYFQAARMQTGELERGPVLRFDLETVIYDITRFEAQILPYQAQGAALRLWGSRLSSTRLASLWLAGAALFGCAALVRARWGPRSALLMLGAGVAAPLWLGYAQRGYYVAASELHAVACLALLLRFERRRSLEAAVLLGLLLGASVYLYQLSYFVPLLCGLCLLATPSLLRQRPAAVLATLAGVTLLTALPAAWWFRDGLGQVYAQSVDKWVPYPPAPAAELQAVATVMSRDREAAPALAQELRERGLRAESWRFGRRYAALSFGGTHEQVADLFDELSARGWSADPTSLDDTLLARARRMAAQLFVGPAHEQQNSWVSGPLLDPVVAPLLVLGVVVAWKRRADVLSRYLAIWVGVGWLLPALAADALPRRALLAFPFGFALAARAWLEATSPAGASRAQAAAVGLVRTAFAALALLAGAGLYYGTWVHPQSETEDAVSPSALELEDLVRGLSGEELVLVTHLVPRLPEHVHYLNRIGVTRPRLERASGVQTPWVLRRQTCRREPPVTWLTLDTPEQRAAFDALAPADQQTRHAQGELLAVRLAVRPACSEGAGRPGADESRR